MERQVLLADAERMAPRRLRDLKEAALEVAAKDSYLKLLVWEIFERTASGNPDAPPFEMDGALLGILLCCSERRAWATLALARESGLISVRDSSGVRGGSGRNHYAVNWAGVYAILGLDMPEFATPTTQLSYAPRADRQAGDLNESVSSSRGAAYAPAYAAAGALSCLELTVVVDNSIQTMDWDAVYAEAAEMRARIFPRDKFRGLLSRRERELFLCLLIMVRTVMDRAWLESGIEITLEEAKHNRGGFLRIVLANTCWFGEGEPDESLRRARFDSLMRAIQPHVRKQEFLHKRRKALGSSSEDREEETMP